MRARSEEGVTLIELLIAITITSIIMAPIAGAIFVGLRTTGATQNRVQESAGVNLLSSYFGPDVQNSTSVANGSPTESPAICPAPLTPNVALLLTTQPGVSSISYYRGTGTKVNALLRRVCAVVAGAPTAAPPTVTVRYLAAGAGALLFTCAPACDATWRSVTATVSQQNLPFDAAPFVSTVAAARRVS